MRNKRALLLTDNDHDDWHCNRYVDDGDYDHYYGNNISRPRVIAKCLRTEEESEEAEAFECYQRRSAC